MHKVCIYYNESMVLIFLSCLNILWSILIFYVHYWIDFSNTFSASSKWYSNVTFSLSVLKHYIGACVYLVSRDVLAQDLIPIALSFGWRRENVLFQSVHSSFPLSYRWSKWKSRLTYILWKVRQQKENSNTHGQTSSSVNPSESDQFRTTW